MLETSAYHYHIFDTITKKMQSFINTFKTISAINANYFPQEGQNKTAFLDTNMDIYLYKIQRICLCQGCDNESGFTIWVK